MHLVLRLHCTIVLLYGRAPQQAASLAISRPAKSICTRLSCKLQGMIGLNTTCSVTNCFFIILLHTLEVYEQVCFIASNPLLVGVYIVYSILLLSVAHKRLVALHFHQLLLLLLLHLDHIDHCLE